MLLGGLQKLSLIDYPGCVAATVFTVGCNFYCPFCHNPELVDRTRALHQFIISEKEFFDFLASRQEMIEGVCVTGGEPTLHPDIKEFLAKIKNLGFLVKLDTNGTKPELLADLLKEKTVDYVAMDIKAPLEKYHKIVNADVDMEKIYASSNLTRQFPDYEFRTTVVPTLHQKEDFLSIARWLEGAKKYYLQQFRPEETLEPGFSEIKPYSDEELINFCQTIKPFFERCEVRI